MIKKLLFCMLVVLFGFNCFGYNTTKNDTYNQHCYDNRVFTIGPSGECAVCRGKGAVAWTDLFPGHSDRFVYCNKDQDKGCDGRNDNNVDRRLWMKAGDLVRLDLEYGPDEWVACCHNGKLKKTGVTTDDAPAWVDKNNTEAGRYKESTKDLGNNLRCTVKSYMNICDEWETVDCIQPDSCSNGYTFRNNECVLDCAEGQAFKSWNSNECIPCVPDYRTSIYFDESFSKVCVRCEQTQYYYNGSCKDKTNFYALDKRQIKSCFQCAQEMIENCWECVAKADVGEFCQGIYTSCKIKTNN